MQTNTLSFKSYWVPNITQVLPYASTIKSWLTTQSSLTKKAEKSLGHIEIELITSEWQYPLIEESKLLKTPRQHLLFTREIYMTSNSKKYWFARCIMPKPMLKGKLKSLASLGQKSLATLLFPNKRLKRTPFEFAILKAQHIEYQKALQFMPTHRPTTLMGRRSQFSDGQYAFLLIEVFLPDLLTIC